MDVIEKWQNRIKQTRMQKEDVLKGYGKKIITLSELSKLLSINPNEAENVFKVVKELEE